MLISLVKKQDLFVNLIPIYLCIAFFLIPLSSTGKSIFIVLSLLTILSVTAYRQAIIQLLYRPWCLVVVTFFIFACAACLWSPATFAEKSLAIEKYIKFLYLPILTVGFQTKRTRDWALHAFLFAMGITCAFSVGKAVSAIATGQFLTLNVDDAGTIFRNHIMTGYMMSFASYLSLSLCFSSKGKISSMLLYATLWLVFTVQVLFINTGRTGYLIYFILMSIFVMQHFSWKKAWWHLLGVVIIAGLSVGFSPVMQQKLQETASEWRDYHQNSQDTSLGYRLQFHNYAASLYKKSPIWGHGTASFTHLYAKDAPIDSWTHKLLEPHSQYWLIAVEFGALGLFLFAVMLSVLLQATLSSDTKNFAVALIISFIACCFTDSFFFYSGTGYFFVVLMALCLGPTVKPLHPCNCA